MCSHFKSFRSVECQARKPCLFSEACVVVSQNIELSPHSRSRRMSRRMKKIFKKLSVGASWGHVNGKAQRREVWSRLKLEDEGFGSISPLSQGFWWTPCGHFQDTVSAPNGWITVWLCYGQLRAQTGTRRAQPGPGRNPWGGGCVVSPQHSSRSPAQQATRLCGRKVVSKLYEALKVFGTMILPMRRWLRLGDRCLFLVWKRDRGRKWRQRTKDRMTNDNK